MRRAALFARGYPATPTFTRKSSFDISLSGGYFSNGPQALRSIANVPNSQYAWTATSLGSDPLRRFRELDLDSRSFTTDFIEAPTQTGNNSVSFATENSLYGLSGSVSAGFHRDIVSSGDTAAATIVSNWDKTFAASDGDKIWTAKGRVLNVSDGLADSSLAISGITYNGVFLTDYFVYFVDDANDQCVPYIKKNSERRSEADFSIGTPPLSVWRNVATYNEYIWILSFPSTSAVSSQLVCWEIS